MPGGDRSDGDPWEGGRVPDPPARPSPPPADPPVGPPADTVPGPAAGPEVVARADGVLGEVVLRRRPGPVHELIVNGVFLMDTVDTSTERLLATVVSTRHPAPARVLVGGLGLGYTLAALLVDDRLRQVVVVEIEPALVEWARAGRLPGATAGLADPRVTVRTGDVRQVLTERPARYDAVVLDVDNGPGFLVHDRNGPLYRPDGLAGAASALRPGGLLVVWSCARAPELRTALAARVGPTEELVRRVRRGVREFDYYVYVAARAGGGAGQAPSRRCSVAAAEPANVRRQSAR